MKRAWIIAVMVLVWELGRPAILGAAEPSGVFPASVVLDGLTTILGDKQAVLEVSFPNSFPKSISLVEGQTFQGIQLLTVDVPAASIRIDNCGQMQTIKIRSRPDIVPVLNLGASGFDAAPTDVRSVAGGNGAAATSMSSGGATSSSKQFFPGAGGSGAGSSAASPINGNAASGGSDSGNASPGTASSGGGTSPSEHVYYWWLDDAKQIEQTRIATAQSVMAGEMDPQPRTPLTPSDTPAQLISSDTIYMDHGPGIIVSDKGAVIGAFHPN